MRFVVPRIVARTREVVRAVVRIESPADLRAAVKVSAPSEEQPTSPSREALLDAVRGKPDAGSPEALDHLLTALEEMGAYVDPLRESIAVRFPDPRGDETDFRILRVTKEGLVRLGRLKAQLEREGYPGEIAVHYAEAIASWIPGAVADRENGDVSGPAGRMFPVRLISEAHREEYLRLVADVLEKIQDVARTRDREPQPG